ncbi:DinB family protein [Sinomicrobium weinanense]|uniref:DinB family protein n=1 Tax=Sinomicrobium weinanense TaxID=2842200 RepID=A0A926Q3Q4_9FLAO|nr:DinB family protein [Sinomicrobium weinanense]MBC9797827.1 DinB family protein [Sinomicrobium weinanense]MBU3124662.1 DinB family protein [Sinomicrobium weinanense]
MKKVSILIAAFVILTAFSPNDTIRVDNRENPVEITFKNDKQALLDYFKETNKNLLKNVKGLSSEQLQYKASPEKWSVAQCLEHIILTEEYIFGMVEKLMQEPANPERKEEIKISGEDLIKGMTDRSNKAKAPEEIQPSGKYTDVKEAIKAFEKQRAGILKYIKNAKVEDMRNHVTDSPFGAIDGYQFALFIASHTARHTLQIEEVKADAGFPSE